MLVKNKFISKIIKRLQKLRKYYFLLLDTNKYFQIILYDCLNFEYIFLHNINIPDVIIANDWNGLYLASELKKKNNWHSKIYFDAHEYAPREWENSLKWRFTVKPLIIWALKKCINDISIMSTVCDGIAREYERFYNFPEGFVRIITNAAEYGDTLQPNKIERGVIRLIHHGGARKARKLELMIKMMKYLDPKRFELTFMLVQSEPEYYKYLVKISQMYSNIKFIEPVPFNEIIKTLNNYDLGVYILKPNNFNNKYALPNKLFEYIQARLAIAIGPSVEMVKIIERYNLGVYSENFSPKSLAKAIALLTPEKIMEYKQNADKFAKELSAENNINEIKTIINELTGK